MRPLDEGLNGIVVHYTVPRLNGQCLTDAICTGLWGVSLHESQWFQCLKEDCHLQPFVRGRVRWFHFFVVSTNELYTMWWHNMYREYDPSSSHTDKSPHLKGREEVMRNSIWKEVTLFARIFRRNHTISPTLMRKVFIQLTLCHCLAVGN